MIDKTDTQLISFCHHLAECYQTFSGQPLMQTPSGDLLQDLYKADFILVAHRMSDDPVFCFANLQAQKLWEMNWDEFTSTPSRQSAPEYARAERQTLLDAASERNIINDYAGVRISKSGRLFRIIDVTLWNIFDNASTLIGQAARFDPTLVEYIE